MPHTLEVIVEEADGKESSVQFEYLKQLGKGAGSSVAL